MLNDDLISAYLDGELDAERRAFVERQLRFDTGAAGRFERLRAADHALKKAFPAEQHEDDALASIILAGGASVQAPRRWMLRVGAIAAAIVFGLIVGQSVRDDSVGPTFVISRQQAQLLNTQLSGEVTATNEGAFEVVLSLRSDDGETCRQFRLTRDERSTHVLACRSGDDWKMVAAAAATVAEGYVPAGASSPLDAAIENLGPVTALTLDEEREFILDRRR